MSEVENTGNATQMPEEATQVQDQAQVEAPAQSQEAEATLNEQAATEEVKEEQAKVVPEKYEYNKEGLLLSEKEITRLESEAKEKGLSQDEFAALMENDNARISEFVENRKEAFLSQVKTWGEQAMNDPEFGGDNFVASSENAKRAIDKFGGESLKQILNETGYGNHPEIFKAFAKIGKAMSDDSFVKAKAHAPAQPDRLARYYPSMK